MIGAPKTMMIEGGLKDSHCFPQENAVHLLGVCVKKFLMSIFVLIHNITLCLGSVLFIHRYNKKLHIIFPMLEVTEMYSSG
jgi:hypothetical protein